MSGAGVATLTALEQRSAWATAVAAAVGLAAVGCAVIASRRREMLLDSL